MIGTLIHVGWLSLRRNRVSLSLVLLLPVLFFSVFAAVFSSREQITAGTVEIAVVDEDQSAASVRLLAALERRDGVHLTRSADGNGRPLDRETAAGLVAMPRFDEDDKVPVALVIPSGFGDTFAAAAADRSAEVELLADVSNPVAHRVVSGLLEAVSLEMAAEQLGAGPLRRSGFAVELVDVVGGARPGQEGGRSLIAFYAAGIAVMFLLFSVTGASGALLDEEENGILERVLNSGAGMGRILLAKWIYLSLLGLAQVTVMFGWAALVFDLDLWTPHHLAGFALMSVVTAASASAFALVLATLCRDREQQRGLSRIIVLIMSAMGGSMLPRFMMPEWMQQIGLVTFNAWALDGYEKVFWYDRPLLDLWPQLGVLLSATLVFLTLSRFLAKRWESV